MRARAGFSVLELVIAAAVLSAIMLVITTAVSETLVASRRDIAYAEASREARAALQQLVRELSQSGVHEGGLDHVLSPARNTTTVNGTVVEFQRRIGISGTETSDWEGYTTTGAITASPNTRIRYDLAASPGEIAGNSIDDDRDGLVDEQTLRRRLRSGTSDVGPVVVLSESVTLFRVDRASGGDLVTLTIEVGRGYLRGAGLEVASARLATNVYLRNQDN